MKGIKLILIFAFALSTLIVGKEQNEIVNKFLEQSSNAVTSFESVRYINASSLKLKKSADLVVKVNLSSNTNLDFQVVSKSGSEFIQSKILEYLEEEKKNTRSIDPAKVAFTSENYVISLKSSGDDGFVQLWSKPVRKDNFLIDGILFVNSSGELARVEGRLIKNPSWFTSSVDVRRSYLNIANSRLVEKQDLIANLRFGLGQSEMHTRYVYSSINGKVVENE